MSKFSVLKYNQILMAKIGIHSFRITEPKNEFFKSFVACFILFILTAFSITSCAVFAYKNIAHFEPALEAIFVVIAGIQCAGMFLSVGLKMKNVKLLQIELQQIVDKGIFSCPSPKIK